MQNVLMRIRAKDNPKLVDDIFVEQCMTALRRQYPMVKGYMYERVDDEYIQVLIYGNLKLHTDE